jgi:flagellar biosynthesis/type III secretory pathway protein FliH
MSSSSPSFTLGLDFDASRPVQRVPVVTTAPFGVPTESAEPLGAFRPMVFQPFDGVGTIVTKADLEAEEAIGVLEDVEVVEAVEEIEEPPPPPPDFEAIKAAAWTEGFQQGYDEGLRLANQEQQEISTRLGALLHDVAADNEALVRALENQVVELALAVAEKVIAREAKADPQVILNVVRSALSEIHDATELRIHVNPDDYPLLETRWQEMLPRSVAERSELTSDDLVERGGVIVETRIGYVDSQLKTRLNQVVTSFQGVLDGEPA